MEGPGGQREGVRRRYGRETESNVGTGHEQVERGSWVMRGRVQGSKEARNDLGRWEGMTRGEEMKEGRTGKTGHAPLAASRASGDVQSRGRGSQK